MKQSLIQIAQDAFALEELIQSEGGELNEALETFLQEITTNLATKADKYSSMMDTISDTAERYRVRAEAYRNAAKSAENMVVRMKQTIQAAMGVMGVEELPGNTIRFKLQNSPASLVIDDHKLVPKEYEIVTIALDNQKIKSALKDNIPVPGARLEQSKHLRTYLRK